MGDGRGRERGGGTLATRLLPHLDARFLFVVGKGGVGKTTTAGALAVALADRGERTCLISTDPAHSLGDLFDVDLGAGDPLPSPCGAHLVLEALDADRYGRRWMERARRPLIDLFDRGTYLDREDIEGFLDLTLPGVDEVAGALRLAELAEEDFGRVVVDTAPTGHALRLLDAGEVVRAWTGAFDAIAEKAAAVIGRLTRRSVRLEADDLTQELRARVERFRDQVLGGGAAVLVDRAGSVVEAETGRLHEAVEARGLRVALRVRVSDRACEAGGELAAPHGEAAGTPLVEVPFHTGLVGCEGLRRWGEAEGEGGRETHRAQADRRDATAFLRALPPLLVFVGKGGVGKSTCAAAAALALAASDDVTLLGTDPAGSLEDVLGVRLTGGEGRVEGGLHVRQVRASAEFETLAARYRDSVEAAFRSLGLEGSAALDRRVVESLVDLAPPGLDEVFAVSALLDDLGGLSSTPSGETPTPGGRARRVVVDTAPTGHFLRLVAMPRVALDWTRQLLRILHKYRAVLGLDAFAERLLDFAKQLKELNLILSDRERSAVIVVTQPGPLVAAESRRLMARVRESGLHLAGVLANRTPDDGAPRVELPDGAVALRAPALREPPVGPAALERFLSSWTIRSAER